MNTKLLRSLSNLALNGDGVGGRKRDGYKLAACLLDKRGRPVSYGINSYKSHPLAVYYSDYPFVHAELDVCVGHGLRNCSGLDLVVVRVLKDGSLTMAKPCNACTKLMQDIGIRKTIYSNWAGELVEDSIRPGDKQSS